MSFTGKLSLLLAALTVASAVTSCAVRENTGTSITASAGAEKYAEFLAERLGNSMPDSTVIAMGEDAEKYGVDLSDFVDDEGYTIRANGGDVVILGKNEAALDRGVRQYAKYGNADNYSFTYGEGYRVGRITIAGHDISEYSVMLPEETDECHGYAADNMQKYIGKACGYYPEIVEYSAEAEGRYIRLERVYPEDEDYAVLGDEGFTIKVDDNGDMIISGGHYRGCMYGVFDFLEDCIGWRFLYDPSSYKNVNPKDYDYLFEADEINIPADLEYTETPSIPVRQNIFRGTIYGTDNLRLKRKINSNIPYNMNRYGLTGFACHGLLSAVKHEIFSDFTFYPLVQPCFTDEAFIEACKEYFTLYTQTRINSGQVIGRDFCDVDVSQFDSNEFCHCEECIKYYVLDGGNAGPVLYFTNTMARHLKEQFGDGIQVSMFAYWGTTVVPKVTRPDDNVNVSFCFFTETDHGECHSHPLSGDWCSPGTVSNKLYGEQLRGWSEITNILTVWYYPGYWWQSSVTVPFIRVLRGDIAFLKECGVDGIYICTEDYGMADEKIIPYLASKLAWDADMTEEEYDRTVEEYYSIIYGDGYEYLLEYEDKLNEYANDTCWTTNILSNVYDRLNLNRVKTGFLSDILLFERAKALADTADQERYIEELSISMYFTGLAASYDSMWEKGDDGMRADYKAAWDTFVSRATEYRYFFRGPFVPDHEDIIVADRTEEFAEPFNMFERFGFIWIPAGLISET